MSAFQMHRQIRVIVRLRIDVINIALAVAFFLAIFDIFNELDFEIYLFTLVTNSECSGESISGGKWLYD